jgi:hypothetical protein
MPVSPKGNMIVLLGLTLPATEHLGIDAQVAGSFRDPIAMIGHQTYRFLFELLCILTPLF